MKKEILVLVMLGLFLAMPLVLAQEGHSDNSIGSIFHIVSILLIVIAVILAFMAAGMFAEELGKAMKFIGFGMALVGINIFMEELSHFEIMVIPEGVMHSLMFHVLQGIGFILIAYGFYRVYAVAKGISTGSKKK